MDDFHKERDENTMKNRNRLIASAFALMMVMSLLVSGVAVLADSGSNVSAPGATYIGPKVSAVSANLTGTYNNTGTVYVKWTVQNNSAPWSAIWNQTKLLNVTGTWEELTWKNDSKLNVRKLIGLTDGVYILKVRGHFWNSTEGAFQNTSENTCTFTVDKVIPTVTITTPTNGGRYNFTNFTAQFSASNGSTGSPLATFTGALTNVTGASTGTTVNLATSATTAPITKFYDWASLTVGEWSLKLTATDAAGNSKIVYSNFTIGPYVVITNPGAGVNTLNFTATWTPHLMPGVAIKNYTAYLYNVTNSKAAGLSKNVTTPQIWITNITAGKALLVNGKTYKLFVNVTDMALNTSSNNVTFVVDTIPPTVSWASPVNGTYTSNASAAIRWTASGTGSPITGSVVTLYNMTTAGSKSISIAGTTNTTSLNDFWGVPLVNGLYKLKVVVTDLGGNTAQNSTNVTVDVTKPTIVIDAPLNGTYWNDNNFVAQWTANGTGSAIASSNVTIYGTVNKSKEITGITNTTNMSSVWGAVLPDGVYRMTVEVFDSAGNSAMAETNFTVDTEAPTIAIQTPIDGTMTNNPVVEFTWIGVDLLGSGVDHYRYNLNGTWVIYAGNNISFTLPEGNYTFMVQAFDKAGNPSIIATTSIMVDLTAPTLSIDAPVDGALIGASDVLVSWTANDPMSGIAEYAVNINGTWIVVPSTNNSYLFTDLSDGAHEVLVKATDNVGNSAVMNVSFTTDITSPYVVIVTPANDAIFNVNSTFVEWTVTDNTTGVELVQVWVDDGTPVNVTNLNYTVTGLSEGPHVIHVKAWDMVGNSQEKMVSILVDLTAPDVFITYPLEGQHLNDTVINATWVFMDDISPVVKIEVAIDDGLYVDVGLNTSQLFAGVLEGNHIIYVRAWDSANNNGTTNVSFTVDRTPPTVVSHSPASGAFVLPDVVVKVNFSEPMNQSSVAFTGISGTMAWNAAGNEVTLTHANLTFATVYNVGVSGKDLAGNAVSQSWSFTVKTQVTGTINDDKGNPIVNATVTISQGGVTVVEGVTDANGHFALIVDGVGTYNLTVSASGFQDLVQNDKAFGVDQTNSLGAMAMTPNPDYTLLIVGVIVVLAIVLVAVYLMRRKPAVKKP